MKIIISSDGVTSDLYKHDADAELTILEKKAVSFIRSEFEKRDIDFDCIRFRRRSNDYLTLLSPNDYDFCRLKTTERVTWFTVFAAQLPEEIKNDSRFNGNKKTLLHWKVKLQSLDDLKNNSDLIADSFLSICRFTAD